MKQPESTKSTTSRRAILPPVESQSAWPSSSVIMPPQEDKVPKQPTRTRTAKSVHELAFLNACRKGELLVAMELLDNIALGVRLEVEDKDGAQGMHWACLGGQLEVVAWLHERGVPLDVQTTHGAQPIHWASYGGQIACAQWLVARGVALDAEDSHGQQPLHWATRSSQYAIARWLQQRYISYM